MEIEKKYLLRNMNILECKNYTRVEQHYVCLSQYREVRVRSKGLKYFLTIKGGGLLERNEWESEISQETYEALIPASIGSVIKDRYEILLPSGEVAELDIYRGNLEAPGHVTVEVEFDNAEQAENFQEPDWFGKEVTDDARYKNKNLAINGWPQ